MSKKTWAIIISATVVVTLFVFSCMWVTRPASNSYALQVLEEAKGRQDQSIISVSPMATDTSKMSDEDKMAEKVSYILMNDEEFVSAMKTPEVPIEEYKAYTDQRIADLEDEIKSLKSELEKALAEKPAPEAPKAEEVKPAVAEKPVAPKAPSVSVSVALSIDKKEVVTVAPSIEEPAKPAPEAPKAAEAKPAPEAPKAAEAKPAPAVPAEPAQAEAVIPEAPVVPEPVAEVKPAPAVPAAPSIKVVTAVVTTTEPVVEEVPTVERPVVEVKAPLSAPTFASVEAELTEQEIVEARNKARDAEIEKVMDWLGL